MGRNEGVRRRGVAAEPVGRPRLSPTLRAARSRFKRLAEDVGEGLEAAGRLAWQGPNTALGLGYGLVGHGLGKVLGAKPRIQRTTDGLEFIGNPLGGVGAITLGSVTTYNGDPYNPNDKRWYPNGEDPRTADNGHSYQEHEKQHRTQARQLGPLYLPSNLLGGVYALVRDGDWHGPRNWNEAGPQANPSRPWLGREP